MNLRGVTIKAAKLIVIWPLLLMGACSPASITMDSNFQEMHMAAVSKEKCNVVIGSIEDHRRDKESLGAVVYTEVFSVDSLLWVENGFKSFGVTRSPGNGVLNQQQLIQVSLKVAHISNLLSVKAANTVLGLSHDSFEEIKYFRGSHSSINWNSSAAEIKKAFDISLALAIQSMVEYMGSDCERFVE